MTMKSISEIKGISPSPLKSTWVHRWETRCKTVTCLSMLVGIVSLKTPWLLLLICLCLFLMVLSMGMTLKQIFFRISWLLPFLLFMSLSLLISGGLPLEQGRIQLVLLLIFKALSALLLMLILFLSQSALDLLTGLASLKVPPVIVTVLFLSWRYLFLFWGKLVEIYRALSARLFKPSVGTGSYRIYGEIIGGMIVKSIDGSEKIYRAMQSRGFNGRIPTGPPKGITSMDILKSSFFFGSMILLHIIEKWRF